MFARDLCRAGSRLRLLLGAYSGRRTFSSGPTPSYSRSIMLISGALLAGMLGFAGYKYYTDDSFKQKIDARAYLLLGKKRVDYLQVTPENLSLLRAPFSRTYKFVQIHPDSGMSPSNSSPHR